MRYSIIIVTIFTVLTSFAYADLKNGLVLYLSFDEGQGDVAKDLSGKNNHGVIQKAKWVDGKFGKALSFNGTDSFVEIKFSNDFIITEAITLAAWVTANVPFDPVWHGVINARKSTYGPFLMQTGGASKAEIGLYLGGAWTWLRSTDSLEPNVFHHVVGVYDLKDGLHIYFDGKLNDGEGSAGAKPAKIDETTDEGIFIGHNYSLAGRFWDGIIDEVAIYNRALSAAEVEQLFKAPPVSSAVDSSGKLAVTWGKMKNR